MKVNKFNLLFFGSDIFSITVLRYLIHSRVCPIQVVTKSFSQLDKFSVENQIPRHKWPLTLTGVERDKFNIGLVASFGQLIDVDTINLFRHGLFNIHPSLLPKYRGSTPIQRAILDGVEETGCTIMRIPPVAKFDIGDIIIQEKVRVGRREYALELRDRLALLGAQMAHNLLDNFEQCMNQAKPQGIEGKSYAKKLKPEQGLLSFKLESSAEIDRKVRAYTGFIDLYTYCLNGLKIRLEDMRDPNEIERYDLNSLSVKQLKMKDVIVEESFHLPAGTIFFHKTRHLVCFKCTDNRWVVFDHITPEFKPKLSALDFYNGYLSKVDCYEMKTDA